MPSISLDQVLACPNLPSLPAVAVEVLALTTKPNVSLEEIARIVQNDQALSARILKTVNSSFYGLSKPCPTITRAIAYLGLNTVKSLVLGFSLVDCSRSSDEGFDLIDYWRRCIYSAAAARCIAMGTHVCDPEEAFTAALMQDVGMTAIYNAMGAGYEQIISETHGVHERLQDAEFNALGFHHPEVGFELARRWRLPTELADAIRLHHNPDAASAHIDLIRTIALGSRDAATLTHADAGEDLADFRARAMEWFNISPDAATTLLSNIAREAGELAQLFQVNTGQPADINAILAQAEEASLHHQLMVQRETQELRETNSTLAQLAVTDALTGVGNRKQFDTELTRLFARAQASNGALGLVMIDADRFKSLNDNHGHQAGDMVLVELARRVQETISAVGIVCRYGGEEFAVLLPGADRKLAATVAESIRKTIEAAPIDISDLQGPVSAVPVTISLGVAAMEPTQAGRFGSTALLVRAADRALYAAKQSGRNCVRVFSAKAPAAAA